MFNEGTLQEIADANHTADIVT